MADEAVASGRRRVLLPFVRCGRGRRSAETTAFMCEQRCGGMNHTVTTTLRDRPPMTLEFINPEDLPTPPTYTHVVVARGSRLVFVAGQEPEDEHGNIIRPGDLVVQARQVFSNVGRALAAAGARPEQVTKITIFVVDYRREHLPAIEAGRRALFGDHKPADTLVGVEALSRPEYLIEVDAIAVIDD
jgi:enamine deaminase RidA (YjgF/YER057c/UK114 family)